MSTRVKKLSELLKNVETVNKMNGIEANISSIHFDSREVIPDSLFVAVIGNKEDGKKYIPDAIKKGATIIVSETENDLNLGGVIWIQVSDSRTALAQIAQNFYDNPSEKLKLIGVTGTNGKTTTATLLYKLFLQLGHKSALISTVENKINDVVYPTSHTTPDPIKLAEFLSLAVKEKCEYAFMECSSHAIDQKRTLGLHFKGCIFTNLTHDHLDYHETLEKYAYAKKKLFDDLGNDAFALGNLDDAKYEYILSGTRARKYSFSLKDSSSDYFTQILGENLDGLTLKINGKEIKTKLTGRFNAYNISGIYATAKLLGVSEDKIVDALSLLTPPTGRLEYLKSKNGIYGVVDYAHTPDALENILTTLREVAPKNSKIITVVGCGGDRDTSKRAPMAKISCKLSNSVIFTSDNPRTEDPEKILDDMTQELSKEYDNFTREPDRASAISLACNQARMNDIVLVAGKGHETYQIFKNETIHFSDMEELNKNLQ